MSFRVWAPHARTVELVTNGSRTPLVAAANGYHTLDALLEPAGDYWLSLDGGPPLPDPRSPYQPAGIAGPSRPVDHSAFAWKRLSALVGPAALRQAAALMLLAPFVPMLFQGEEWGASTPFFYFTDHGDAALARDVKEGREREYRALGFDLTGSVAPDAVEAFERSRLRWAERAEPEHRDVLEWYGTLVRLRRSERDFARLPLAVTFDEQERWLLLDRGSLAVAVCFADTARALPFTADAEIVLRNGTATLGAGGVHVGAHGVAVLRRSAAAEVT